MKRLTLVVGVGYLCLLLLSAQPGIGRAGSAFAQSGVSYDLSWHVIAGGGRMFSAGGTYALGGTLGQSGAGTLGEGAYILTAGFWAGTASTASSVYLPLVVR
ncbi:MAG: hypothetical protein E6J26_06635 [Chloroflexi bacterium]|nr:MAG: hypothetical protein E6J26_06635 [Chloroflexota bacterium]